MPRHQLVVLTQAVPGREEEFHRWYDEHHLPEIVDVPGVVGAVRSRVEIIKGTQAIQWHSMAIYELNADDPNTILDEISRRRKAGRLTWSDALNMETIVQIVGSPVKEIDKGAC